jgi:hypothetical protein
MPTFIDYHSMGRCGEDDLKKSQKKPIAELGVNNPNTFYAVNSGRVFCLLDAGQIRSKKRHSKFDMKCEWISPVNMTLEYEGSD